MEDEEALARTVEFHESKKPLKQRLIEGLGLQYEFNSHSYSVGKIRIAAEQVTNFSYLREKFRNDNDLLNKLTDIFEKAIAERHISALFGRI